MIFLNKQSQSSIDKYIEYLKIIGGLSNLFSSSDKPFVQYRVAENAFCKAFNADNLARADVAYDAIKDGYGIGCKTFILSGNTKIEKIAEFNSCSEELRTLEEIELANRLADERNKRVRFADREYNINDRLYHIVGRDSGKIKLFDTSYDLINKEEIQILSNTSSSLKFKDDLNEYNFNYSKSVLMKRFTVPDNCIEIDIDIISNPLELLANLEFTTPIIDKQLILEAEIAQKKTSIIANEELVPGKDYVILPLYSPKAKQKSKDPIVPLKSQLNQWNAGGRARDYGEVYIPVPSQIHKCCPCFFPDRDIDFKLKIANGDILSAKLCQMGAKALMTNPNNALATWMLRKILEINEGEVLTYQHLLNMGYDCVQITKTDELTYKIDFAQINEYENFIERFNTQ